VDGDADHLHHTVPAVPGSVRRLRHAAVAFAAGHGANAEVQAQVALAVSEAATNAVVHAYRAATDRGVVHLDAQASPGAIRLTVRDDGCGMEPRADSPGVGLGLPLLAQVTDELEVVNEEGTSVLMAFVLSGGAPGPLH
jgi:anti-sigma regulatory factor (Ser/Thr protein kinase)